MPVKKLSISLFPGVVEAVDVRGEERSTTINKMLERYLAVLEQSRRKLMSLLTEAETGLILDALNGALFADTLSLGYVHHEIADAIALDRLNEKWQVDGPALVEKLKTLSYAENVALVDAVERWWSGPYHKEEAGTSPTTVFRRG